MYPLAPMKVFVRDDVRKDPVCAARLERMLGALANTPEIRVYDESSLPEAAAELETLWPPASVPAGTPRSYTRPLIFTKMDLRPMRPDIRPILAACAPSTPESHVRALLGYMTTAIDQHPHQIDRVNNCVCWPTYNFGTVMGCSHGCLYCGTGRAGKYLAIALNLEEYMEKIVRPVIEANPWNKVFRMINEGADLVTLEPEYGLHDVFSRTLALYEGRYGHFHTGSENVAWMAGLPHKDRLVGVWSVTCDAVAKHIEPGAGTANGRFDAGRLCQGMGIPVRYKFKPIIPVKDWRTEYGRAIEYALKVSDPESVGFSLYIWNTYETMAATLPLDLLDPEFVSAAKKSAEEMKGSRVGPFPHEFRREVYRFMINEVRRWNKETLLYVSTESREMWDDLKKELGQDPRAYVCGCSSVAVPGRKLALSGGLRYSSYHPTPV